MTAKVFESAKVILVGSPVCIDQKCKSSQQTDLTPVIVTSNTNMCAVMDGNSITFEHQQPLEDQIFKFELVCQLDYDFGKTTKTEIKEFFAWAKANECDVTREFNVKRVEAKKRSAPSAENISLSKRVQTSFEIETSGEPEVLDFSSRFSEAKALGENINEARSKIGKQMIFCEPLSRTIFLVASGQGVPECLSLQVSPPPLVHQEKQFLLSGT
ncbi:hypothetical protein QTO34_001564 [Cnephaeus nilssonii]|uniref:Parvovirus non-structural protein 1 helicase domain-containing protein n=1 Tax=Cnephaeus nilssonii TaxID=3371016 RepID=A0AA40HVW4_CNENI|nr:hypothetical protein QTO34_001564 [Eptesicus nilssonii]